jgi:hypothetical protein
MAFPICLALIICPIKRRILLSIIFVLGTWREIMRNLNKNNSIVTTTAVLFTLAFFVVAAAVGSSGGTAVNTALATTATRSTTEFTDPMDPERKASAVVSGDNIYIAWWTNNTANNDEEVMFRASNDCGQTFGDKINLSNSPDTQSRTAEIVTVGNNVFISWWELNENVHPHIQMNQL